MHVTLLTDREEWAAFLKCAVNPTLFHDLRFLDYHPSGRFNFHHLVIRNDRSLVGLLPGALSADGVFNSTSGASVGGLVVGPNASFHNVLEAIEAVQAYAKKNGWAAIEMTTPPRVYAPDAADCVSMALHLKRFAYRHRWLCHVLPLDQDWSRRFSSRQAAYVRAAHRAGATAVEGGIELLGTFYRPFRDTFARHGVPATHTEDEIENLMERFPDRIRIHLAMQDNEPLAGLLVFYVAPGVGYTMYIVRSAGRENARGDSVVIADAMTHLAAKGFRYLDLGPSASDMNVNWGVLTFKERLGAVGLCRDRWVWTAR